MIADNSMQQICYNNGNNLRGVGVTCGVYRITDLGNDHVYIGSSVDVEARLRRHKTMLRDGKHFCQHLQNSYALRGLASFTFELVAEALSEDLRAVEEQMIRSYPEERLYNRIMSPIKGVLGIRWTMSEETKRRIGAANKGRGQGISRSAEVRAKISEGGKGRTVSEETRAKLRVAMQSYPASARQKISAANKGRPSKLRGRTLSDETRQKISAANLGRKRSLETRARISAAQTGKLRGPRSDETRQKISAAKLGRPSHPQSEETRAKMRAAQTEAWRLRKLKEAT